METDYSGLGYALGLWFKGSVALVATIWTISWAVDHALNFGRWLF